MKWTLIQLAEFKSLWQAEKLPDEDLQLLEATIVRNPSGSPVMQGTGGLRKIRFAPASRGKGKSGSMRVGYAQFPESSVIYLVTLFLKKSDDNLTRADRSNIKAILNLLGNEIRKGPKS